MEEERREVKPPPQQPTENRQQNLPPPPPQKCPRCDSLDTKFCYYNNYSLSQPRYHCKTCRRYWTHGGTLRNVPIGGACRKKKRVKTTFTQPQPMTNLSVATNYYAGGGFISSLAAMNSFAQPPPPLQVGSSSSSSSIFPGFTLSPPTSQQQYQSHQQTELYKTTNQGLVELNRGVRFLNQGFMNSDNINSGSNPKPSVGTSLNPSFFPDFSGYGPPSL